MIEDTFGYQGKYRYRLPDKRRALTGLRLSNSCTEHELIPDDKNAEE